MLSGCGSLRMVDRKESAMKRHALAMPLIALVGILVCVPMAVEAQSKILKNIPVTGPADGHTFTGKLSIDELDLDGGQMVASGLLIGSVGGRTVAQQFNNVPVTLSQSSTAIGIQQVAPACDILFLNLGPLELDLLGLTVDLSEVTLDINAVPGPGNLLGNLLCALTGLLDGFDLSIIEEILQALLNAINELL
jgi:hypothetical protein